jgi:hypothetical protein
VPLWDSASNTMRTVFFGGMALYHLDSTGGVQKDSLIPFVNTVSAVTRSAGNVLTENILPIEMPGLLGTNAHFIPVAHVHRDGIVKLDDITDNTLVGYIIGGISSPEPNLSLTDPSMSSASNRVFEVWINPNPDHVSSDANSIALTVSPNPASDMLYVTSACDKATVVVADRLGRFIPHPPGSSIDVSRWPTGLYILTVGCELGWSRVPVLVVH